MINLSIFLTGYKEKDSSEMVILEPKLIARKYIKSWYAIYQKSTLPFSNPHFSPTSISLPFFQVRARPYQYDSSWLHIPRPRFRLGQNWHGLIAKDVAVIIFTLILVMVILHFCGDDHFYAYYFFTQFSAVHWIWMSVFDIWQFSSNLKPEDIQKRVDEKAPQ